MIATINNDSNNRTIALERTVVEATGGLNAFYGRKTFALESAVVEKTKVVQPTWRLPTLCNASSPRTSIHAIKYKKGS